MAEDHKATICNYCGWGKNRWTTEKETRAEGKRENQKRTKDNIKIKISGFYKASEKSDTGQNLLFIFFAARPPLPHSTSHFSFEILPFPLSLISSSVVHLYPAITAACDT